MWQRLHDLSLVLLHPHQVEAYIHVLLDGQIVYKVQLLEDEARVVVPVSIQILFQKGLPVHQNLAFGLIVKTTEDVQERGLARPALPTQKNKPLARQDKVKDSSML